METNRYIVVFFTHSGGMKFKRACDKLDIQCEIKPVPRQLSSSCGICAEIETSSYEALPMDDVEKIVTLKGYIEVYKAD